MVQNIMGMTMDTMSINVNNPLWNGDKSGILIGG